MLHTVGRQVRRQPSRSIWHVSTCCEYVRDYRMHQSIHISHVHIYDLCPRLCTRVWTYASVCVYIYADVSLYPKWIDRCVVDGRSGWLVMLTARPAIKKNSYAWRVAHDGGPSHVSSIFWGLRNSMWCGTWRKLQFRSLNFLHKVNLQRLIRKKDMHSLLYKNDGNLTN